MERKAIDSGKIVFVMKCMLAAYLLTAGLLLSFEVEIIK